MVQLSQQQLFAAARFILPADILIVVRQLGLDELDIQQVRHNLRYDSQLANATEQSFQFLFAWRNKYPAKCTLKNLVQALNDLKLRKTAEEVDDAIKNVSKTERELLKDEKCNKKLIINERMASEVSKTLRIQIYTSLGLMLGLDEQQLDHVANMCNADFTTSVFEMLKIWIQQEGSNAVLGTLYTAFRLLDYNADANEVYDICMRVSLSFNLVSSNCSRLKTK